MYRAVTSDRAEWAQAPPLQFSADQLTLSQPGGASLSPLSSTCPPRFSDLATALTSIFMSKETSSLKIILIFNDGRMQDVKIQINFVH